MPITNKTILNKISANKKPRGLRQRGFLYFNENVSMRTFE
ncbi:hypothetical protein PEC301875_16970 [Pectobacterium carotovorum subsp. carotovorum]|nr:hypothetical protein PEC301875_16970 [Pectobacterium carotovorum subsp. carotovorum]